MLARCRVTRSLGGARRSVEVEEDVVLLIYGGPNAPSELRSQRIRVLHDPPRLVPA